MTKQINLALQGGGAHGAFTWGVLDRLLDEERLEVAAISGTSAGALNGAAFKAGITMGGRAGARACLDAFWADVGAVTDDSLTAWMDAVAPAAPWLAQAMVYSPAYAALDLVSRFASPYDSGPLYANPLKPIVDRFNYADICAGQGPALYVGATNVRSGKIRVFTGDGITSAALMASACLPTLFQAVEIEGEAYWDGGYTGNPALFPLFERDLPDDIVIININPLERRDVPRDAQAIQNRINEISFNSSLLRELRAISFVKRLLAGGQVAQGSMKNVLVHMIADDALMNDLSVATKTIPNAVVMARLKSAGREAADAFLKAHWSDLGQRDTVKLEEMFAS